MLATPSERASQPAAGERPHAVAGVRGQRPRFIYLFIFIRLRVPFKPLPQLVNVTSHGPPWLGRARKKIAFEGAKIAFEGVRSPNPELREVFDQPREGVRSV